MSTPQSSPIRHVKLNLAHSKSLTIASEYKRLLNEQHQRLSAKHQQDLELIDDIRSYVKARLSIERDYTSALCKLAKQHSTHIRKKFILFNQCDRQEQGGANITGANNGNSTNIHNNNNINSNNTTSANANNSTNSTNRQSQASGLLCQDNNGRVQKRLSSSNNTFEEPDQPCTLYKVWSEHIDRLQSTSKNRADQFEQLVMLVDKLKDIRSHKAFIGKKCLDTHIKRIHEDIMIGIVELERARKLYYEDENQAKKARENEEKFKKKRSGILTKFTDLQAKKEKTSAQREATDIQSTQARNDYIMALAAANAHLNHYYQQDLNDFIHLIDDGVLDHCKIFMATLSECDINSLKDSLAHSQYWSKLINLTSSQRTNAIFLDSDQSLCLKQKSELLFEPCNNDPIRVISLEHNADFALQHEIDKWFTWFKKECRNLSQLMHQLETCQRALADGKKSIELNGQMVEDIEPKIIDLKQQIRKSETAKLKAQARLKVIKEGGMPIEEWSSVESEIRADMARAQLAAENAAKRLKGAGLDRDVDANEDVGGVMQLDSQSGAPSSYLYDAGGQGQQVQLQVSKESDDSDAAESMHNLASVSRSTSNLMQKQQNVVAGYSALTDPSLVWQDDASNAWGSQHGSSQNVIVTDAFEKSKSMNTIASNKGSTTTGAEKNTGEGETNAGQATVGYELLEATSHQNQTHGTSMTVQSSSPLSAIVDNQQNSRSPYHGMMSEAYKSDYECDYARTSHGAIRSAASSADHMQLQAGANLTAEPFGDQLSANAAFEQQKGFGNDRQRQAEENFMQNEHTGDAPVDAVRTYALLNRRVVGLYAFEKCNEDDLAFNENDILLVTEISDPNWVKAKNESTGEEGFIPVSYIQLLDEDKSEHLEDDYIKDSPIDDVNNNNNDDSAWNTSDLQQQQQSEISYCRALYDHKPEKNTFEEDGLPHLALVKDEIFRIIDQGEDDGWWLVEREDTGERGHVPSMLVEEVEEGVEVDFGQGEDVDEFKESDVSEEHDLPEAMPTIAPPVLEDVPKEDGEETGQRGEAVGATNETDERQSKSSQSSVERPANLGPSLIPTSFVIIEPTPGVESKNIEDSLENNEYVENDNIDDQGRDQTEGQQVIRSTADKPPTNVCYSVVNEDFVLEGPTRKPHHRSDSLTQHHATPTIKEEEATSNELTDGRVSSGDHMKGPEEDYEPLSEADSVDAPAPPQVQIDSPTNKPPTSDEEEEDVNQDHSTASSQSQSSNRSDATPSHVNQQTNHDSSSIVITPYLRQRADEFSKQIIAEALESSFTNNCAP